MEGDVRRWRRLVEYPLVPSLLTAAAAALLWSDVELHRLGIRTMGAGGPARPILDAIPTLAMLAATFGAFLAPPFWLISLLAAGMSSGSHGAIVIRATWAWMLVGLLGILAAWLCLPGHL